MDKQKFNTLLISDFNVDVFAGYLNNDVSGPPVNATAGPFGQVISLLLGQDADCWTNNYDCAIVWTQGQSVIESFVDVLNYQQVPIDKILGQVDQYCQAIINIQDKVSFIFVPTWILPTYHRGYGMLEIKNSFGIENILMQMNLRLAENLKKASNIWLLNTRKWIE